MEAKRCGRLAGRRALVTGSGTGIGREIALEVAREGAAVALHYSHSASGALSAVEEIRAFGGTASAFRADFADLSQVRDLAADALQTLGGLDLLVNNAGVTANIPFERVTPEQFDAIFGVNVRAQFFLTQALVQALETSGGAVVNLSSVHGIAGYPQHTVYAATKGAITALTRCLAIELAPRGIRVNGIAPGAVPVENHRKADPTADPATMGDLIPVGFAGTPLDVARAVVYLGSDDARYMVGQTLVLDGGTTSWLPFGNQFRQPSSAQFGKGYVPGL
jgi:NAD(P)-dependent dehydrogenase (short-subunit alcohol dehydrogenase family)